MTKKIFIGLVSVVLFICILFLVNEKAKNKRIKETLDLALSYNKIKTPASSDTSFEKIYSDSFKKEICIVKSGGKFGLYDSLNKKCLTPINYEDIWSFAEEDAIRFTRNKKFGFLDVKGNEIVPAIYDFASDFGDGLAAVKLNEKWGYIDKSSRVIIPIEYELAWTFKLGRGAVKKNDKWGFINKRGNYILVPKYDDVSYDFTEETEVANVTVNGRHFYIDKNGKYLKDSKPYEKYQRK